MSDSSSRSTPPPLPPATPGVPPPLPSAAPGNPSPVPVVDAKRGWVPPPLPPTKASDAPPASSHASVSSADESSKVLPLGPSDAASEVSLPSPAGTASSSMLDSSAPIGGDSEDSKAPASDPKTAGTLPPPSAGGVGVPSIPGAPGLSDSLGEKIEVSQRAPVAEPLSQDPPAITPVVQEAANPTPPSAAALNSGESRAYVAPSERAPARPLPTEAACAAPDNETSEPAIPVKSPVGDVSHSSLKTNKARWIGVAACVSAAVCAGLVYGVFQWRNAVAEKDALAASRQQEIEARLAEERVQRERAEADAAAARRRAAEAEQAALQAAAAARAASISEPLAVLPANAGDSSPRVSVAFSQELLPLAAQFDVPAGLPLLKEMVDGSVSGDPGRIERAAAQMEALPRPSAGDRRTARSLNNEGLRALNAGDSNAAVELFKRAALADPSDPEILGNLAWAYLRSGRPSVAFDAAVISLVHTPRRASSWGTLGIAMIQQDSVDMDPAVASLQNAYRYAGNQEKSREYFQQIAQHDESPDVRMLAEKVLLSLNGIVSIGHESERMRGR